MVEFKVSDFFYPLDLVRTYATLRSSEHWQPSRFREYQGQKLALLLRHSATHVPYYRNLFRKLGLNAAETDTDHALAQLSRVPMLDKDTLRANPATFVADNASRFHSKPLQTSGTTGTPLTIYWDRGSNVMEFCCIQRLWRWAGFWIGQPFLDLRSRLMRDDDPHVIKQDSIRYMRNWTANALEFDSDSIDASNITEYHRVLLRYRPKLVRGHPQAIQYLAALLRQHGLTEWRPTAVTTASEALYDFQRREIEEAWGVTVLDSYGLREHNAFIAQCPAGSYHISPEYGIVEILDDNGQPVALGEEGWLVATGLHNYAQVLLRYNTRDRAVAGSGVPCRCGRTLPTVERIVGRIDDCIYTRDGRRYSGMAFAFFGRRGIRKARLVQEDMDNVAVQLVVTPEFDQTTLQQLLQALDEKLSHKITLRAVFLEDIVQEKPGKFQFVVSKIPRPGEAATPAGPHA